VLLDGLLVFVLVFVLVLEEVLEVLVVEEVYIKLEFELELGVSHFIFNVPVAASSPNTYNNIVTITVMKINGMNTRIHDMIVIPP
jgi:hypothetical protein